MFIHISHEITRKLCFKHIIFIKLKSDFYQNQITIKNQINTNENNTNKELNIVVCGGDAQILKKWWEFPIRSGDTYPQNIYKTSQDL